MKRFVLQQLIEWKNREDRKPLILNGARQVGKTWLLHEFAKLEYKKRLMWYAVRITLHASFFLRISMLTEFYGAACDDFR